MKRIVLFLVTNLAVMLTLSIIAGLLGFGQHKGFIPLLGFAAVFGFGGAIISLLISKPMAKFSVGAKVIETPQSSEEVWVLNTVYRLAEQAGIGKPEVAIYDSPEINAFATGANRNNALVAVSSGLLRAMTRDEAEAVLAHEVSHVANGDMVTLTLIQGVLNTFVILLSRIVAQVVDSAMRGNNEEDSGHVGVAYYVTSFVMELIFGVVASVIVMWFSRQREFRADAGAGRLTSNQKMIAALQRLKAGQEESSLPQSVTAFGIRGGKAGFMHLFATHPSLDDRIAALQTTH